MLETPPAPFGVGDSGGDPRQPRGSRKKLLPAIGPGLITGASDDDPSGIATYSQAGAQFGFDLGWTLVLAWPLMCAIQEICARIGRVTGHGLARNLKTFYPRPLVLTLVVLLVIANTINIGADLGAMAAALGLLIGGPELLYVALFAGVSVALEIFVSYPRYVSILKWLTLSLFAYLGVIMVVNTPWSLVAERLVLPHISFTAAYLTVVVAILGTTISPYLFFWQAEEEAEDTLERPGAKPLWRAPEQAPLELRRIRFDTYVGMAFSNLVALSIVIATATTLHAHGVTDIQTSAQAAQALLPIAGKFAFLIFALGIIGTGLLALPVLAGSAAFATGEMFGWHVGLTRKPWRAKAFYSVIVLATFVGAAFNFSTIDPMKALFWSAVVNGVVAVPLMVMVMLFATRRDAMGAFAIPRSLRIFGWIATVAMAAASIGMFVTWAD